MGHARPIAGSVSRVEGRSEAGRQGPRPSSGDARKSTADPCSRVQERFPESIRVPTGGLPSLGSLENPIWRPLLPYSAGGLGLHGARALPRPEARAGPPFSSGVLPVVPARRTMLAHVNPSLKGENRRGLRRCHTAFPAGFFAEARRAGRLRKGLGSDGDGSRRGIAPTPTAPMGMTAAEKFQCPVPRKCPDR